MITVKNIFQAKAKSYNYTSPDTLVFDALTMLNSINLSYLIVMDGDQYKGVFSERDYSRNVVLKGLSSKTTTVKEVMTVDLPIVSTDDTVEHCMHTMNSFKTRYLLAFNDEQFMGVITIHDLLRQVINNRDAVFDSSLTSQLLDNDEAEKIY
jgi:CBS domain-containing protein